MEYTVIIGNRSYDLPKKTIGVVEALDKASNIDSVKGMNLQEKFQTVLASVSELIGEENTKEIFGSTNVREVDLTEVTLTMQKIIDAYDKPLNEYEIEKQRRKIDSIPIDKITSIIKAGSSVSNIVESRK